ncbi:hypothetical protein EVAR_42990_1 [Eumeta japonica]|uniref:Lipoprotein n=1 Tax=Eumeta variegata TaxID=151549 RepID=A0A4C1WBJ2_EUMVA|nr:hypothetical protein EVAR_42990_1 [Eumeta japonica]
MIATALCLLALMFVGCGRTDDGKPLDYRDEIIRDISNTDKKILHRISVILENNKTLDQRDIALINRTAQNLGLDKSLLTRLSDLVESGNGHLKNGNGTAESSVLSELSKDVKARVSETYNSYVDSGMAYSEQPPRVGAVEESPDYASSVVLASDLLSLTSAIANVEEKSCREQGYRFLDGLLMNKRWALKSES